jgi:hypothetical protein
VRRTQTDFEGRAPSAASRPRALAPALKLQRAIGNKAVGQVLARSPSRPRQTGLRRDDAIARYCRKAVIFWLNNPDAELHHFARFLGAAANTELNALGIPDVKLHVKDVGGGGGGAAAVFDHESWSMFINPDTFTHRPDEVHTLGDLTADEAAIIAMTVYHEARHGEQHFRIARLEAGQGKEIDPMMDQDAAAAAAADPLKARGGDALELREARDWYSVEYGDDATYREAVTDWQGGIRAIAKAARDVKADETADLQERIGRLLKGWSKDGGAAWYVRSHLASAKQRGATTVVKNVSRINAAYDVVDAAYKKLGANPSPADFKPLADALRELYRAVNKAYEEAPVEFDAYRTGDAVFYAFQKALGVEQGRRKKAAAAAPH